MIIGEDSDIVNNAYDSDTKFIIKEYGLRQTNSKGYTEALTFTEDIANYLESLPWVQAYAQFTPNPSGQYADNFHQQTHLWRYQEEGIELTNNGRMYGSVPSSSSSTGSISAVDPSSLSLSMAD